MITAVLIVLLAQTGLFCWLAKTLLEKAQESAAQENTRLVLLAQAAMEQIAAKSVKEKVEAERLRKEYDVRIEMYRDAVAKQYETAKNKAKTEEKPTPRWVKTDDGSLVDANDVEWMTD